MRADILIERVLSGRTPEEALQEGVFSVPVGKLTLTRDAASAKAVMQLIKDELARARMPRTSKYRGGEITGWIDPRTQGSTGFSVREPKPGLLDFHIVVSGKAAGVRYRDVYDKFTGEQVQEPVDPKKIIPKIKGVFKRLGLDVKDVRYTGHQMMWDDDIDYNVTVTVPAVAAKKPSNRIVLGFLGRGEPLDRDDLEIVLEHIKNRDSSARIGKSKKTVVISRDKFHEVLEHVFNVFLNLSRITDRTKGFRIRDIPKEPTHIDIDFIDWDEY